MISDGQTLKPLKLHARKNWLWLWVLPTVLSWLLVSLTKHPPFWVEFVIICSCSCLCGFVLAIKSFASFKERLWGWLFFTGGSLCVIASVVFIGCFLPSRPSADDIRNGRIRGERDNKGWLAPQIVRRDAQADLTMLDLTSYYDALLPGQFNHYNPSGFRALAPGSHTWDGIKFDVRGMVFAKRQPDGQISGIPIAQKCSLIAFLQGAYLGFKRNDTYGRLVIHFQNGHTETVPLAFGKDLAVSELSAVPPGFDWVMHNAASLAESIPSNGESPRNFVFYIKKWTNPFPDKDVTTIDFVPSPGIADPFLVAITVRPLNH
jgi:hypothetical protein